MPNTITTTDKDQRKKYINLLYPYLDSKFSPKKTIFVDGFLSSYFSPLVQSKTAEPMTLDACIENLQQDNCSNNNDKEFDTIEYLLLDLKRQIASDESSSQTAGNKNYDGCLFYLCLHCIQEKNFDMLLSILQSLKLEHIMALREVDDGGTTLLMKLATNNSPQANKVIDYIFDQIETELKKELRKKELLENKLGKIDFLYKTSVNKQDSVLSVALQHGQKTILSFYTSYNRSTGTEKIKSEDTDAAVLSSGSDSTEDDGVRTRADAPQHLAKDEVIGYAMTNAHQASVDCFLEKYGYTVENLQDLLIAIKVEVSRLTESIQENKDELKNIIVKDDELKLNALIKQKEQKLQRLQALPPYLLQTFQKKNSRSFKDALKDKAVKDIKKANANSNADETVSAEDIMQQKFEILDKYFAKDGAYGKVLWQKNGCRDCALVRGRLFQLCKKVAYTDLSLFVQYFSARKKTNQGFFKKIMHSQPVAKLEYAQNKINLENAQNKINLDEGAESNTVCQSYIDKKQQPGCFSGCLSGLCNFLKLFNQNVPSVEANLKSAIEKVL